VQVSLTVNPSDASRPVAERTRTAEGSERAGGPDGAVPRDKVTVSNEARQAAGAGKKLTPDQQRQVLALQRRDTHVRQHEAAHQAAGGSLTGTASFSYQTGPDGRSYAVGGEVPVRLQAGRTPDETIANARQARRAALAPSDPSAQDLAVAAQASQMEQAAAARKTRLAASAYGKAGKAKGREGGADEAQAASGQRSGDGTGEGSEEPALARVIAA
jgi:hypothetical protein